MKTLFARDVNTFDARTSPAATRDAGTRRKGRISFTFFAVR